MIDDQPEALIDPFDPPRDEPSSLRKFLMLVALAVVLPVGALALVSVWPNAVLVLLLVFFVEIELVVLAWGTLRGRWLLPRVEESMVRIPLYIGIPVVIVGSAEISDLGGEQGGNVWLFLALSAAFLMLLTVAIVVLQARWRTWRIYGAAFQGDPELGIRRAAAYGIDSGAIGAILRVYAGRSDDARQLYASTCPPDRQDMGPAERTIWSNILFAEGRIPEAAALAEPLRGERNWAQHYTAIWLSLWSGEVVEGVDAELDRLLRKARYPLVFRLIGVNAKSGILGLLAWLAALRDDERNARRLLAEATEACGTEIERVEARLNAARIAKRFGDPEWRSLAEAVAAEPGMWQREAERLLRTG
jgi:hypothetical protein